MTRPAGTPGSRGRQQRFVPIIVASEAGRVKDNFPRIGLAAPSRLADLWLRIRRLASKLGPQR
jgi:hypothetical protein